MISIKKLARANKRSGYILKPERMTTVRGVLIINFNKFPIYIDKFTAKKVKKKCINALKA
jgi:hypothetical protein